MRRMVTVLHNDEITGKWSSMVSTTIFFVIPEIVTSERLTISAKMITEMRVVQITSVKFVIRCGSIFRLN